MFTVMAAFMGHSVSQAAVLAELAKIEVQQRVVIQQINSLQSERYSNCLFCSNRTCGYVMHIKHRVQVLLYFRL